MVVVAVVAAAPCGPTSPNRTAFSDSCCDIASTPSFSPACRCADFADTVAIHADLYANPSARNAATPASIGDEPPVPATVPAAAPAAAASPPPSAPRTINPAAAAGSNFNVSLDDEFLAAIPNAFP